MAEPRGTHFSAHEDGDHNTAPTELPLHELAINQLARLRVERGFTQQHVARAMGISQPRVSDIERAELGHVQLDTIRAYIGALGGRLQLLAHWNEQR
jgi:predicted XRE-type DNA-binding protein